MWLSRLVVIEGPDAGCEVELPMRGGKVGREERSLVQLTDPTVSRHHGNIELRDKIDKGVINGPRIIPSERVNLRQTPDEARAAVRALAAKGIKHTGEIALTPEPGPPQAEIEVLKAIVDESAKVGVQVNVHSVIGRVPEVDGAFCAAGFSGHGFKMAPAVGQLVTELVLDGATATFDIRPLRARRFAESDLFGGAGSKNVMGAAMSAE